MTDIKQENDKPKNSITIRDTQETSLMNPEIYTQMKVLANDFINSKAIPKCWETAPQVLVGLQTGLEMGMNPMEAMNSLYVVNGAINIWGKAIAKRLRDHGYTIAYVETPEACKAKVERGDESYIETFKLSDAEASGYTKDSRGQTKIGWRPGQNLKMKLRYGALNALVKTYVPEVLGSASGVAEIENDVERVQVEATVSQSKLADIANAYKGEEKTEDES